MNGHFVNVHFVWLLRAIEDRQHGLMTSLTTEFMIREIFTQNQKVLLCFNNNPSAVTPVEQSPADVPTKRPREVITAATQTIRPLKPLPTAGAATSVPFSEQTKQMVGDYKSQLAEVKRQMAKVECKLNKLNANSIKPHWAMPTTSIELLGTLQELILAKLDDIKDRLKPYDGNVSDDSNDLWGPVTPDEEELCYLGTPLSHCRENDTHHWEHFKRDFFSLFQNFLDAFFELSCVLCCSMVLKSGRFFPHFFPHFRLFCPFFTFYCRHCGSIIPLYTTHSISVNCFTILRNRKGSLCTRDMWTPALLYEE